MHFQINQGLLCRWVYLSVHSFHDPQDPKICLTLWTFILARFGVVAGGQFAGNEFRSIFTKETTIQEILCTMWFFFPLTFKILLLFLNVEVD